MDRNEVILVGRLPEAAHIRLLPSGSRLGTWRLIVRRRHRGRGARVDTIPCASFELEVIEAVAGWLPDDIVEVTGSLRRRWWGSEGAKSSGYEVEVCSVRRLERRVTTILTGDEGVPVPAPPRPVRSLMHAGQGDGGQEDTGQGDGGQEDTGQGDGGREGIGQGDAGRGAEPGLTSVKPDPTSAGSVLAPTGLDVIPAGGPDSASVGVRPGLAGPGLIGVDSTPIEPDVTSVGGPDSVPVGVRPGLAGLDLIGVDSAPVEPGLVPVGLDPDPVGLGRIPVGRDSASAGPADLTPAPSDVAPEGAPVPVPVPVPRAVEASISGRSRVPHLATRADAVSGASE